MEFQQLEMFAALVEEESVTRAADRVCRTPPAVSIAMRKLEEEIRASPADWLWVHNKWKYPKPHPNLSDNRP